MFLNFINNFVELEIFDFFTLRFLQLLPNVLCKRAVSLKIDYQVLNITTLNQRRGLKRRKDRRRFYVLISAKYAEKTEEQVEKIFEKIVEKIDVKFDQNGEFVVPECLKCSTDL